MAFCVAISPSSFADADKTPLKLLEQSKVEILRNPYGRRLTEEEIIALLDGVDGLIAGLEPLNRKVLQSASNLKAIARVGIGMDNVDQQAAKELGIRVSNTPDGPTEAVAELCLTALLCMGRQLIPYNTDLHSGVWKKRLGVGLRGTRILMVGYGRIGRRFGEMLHFFGAKIFVCDPAVSSETLNSGECLVSLEQGIQNADAISLHTSGVDTILGEAEFKKMRPGMILLNSARGELIDEDALIRALKNGTVKAAWADAFCHEPYSGELTKFDQVLLTPHTGTYTSQCRSAMETTAVQNLLRDLVIPLKPS